MCICICICTCMCVLHIYIYIYTYIYTYIHTHTRACLFMPYTHETSYRGHMYPCSIHTYTCVHTSASDANTSQVSFLPYQCVYKHINTNAHICNAQDFTTFLPYMHTHRYIIRNSCIHACTNINTGTHTHTSE